MNRPQQLVIASKNPDKIAEIEAVLADTDWKVQVVRDRDWDEVEETGSTLEENALLKARTVAQATMMPALADDTGLEVAALGGVPGVHTARYAGEGATYADNVRKLLTELDGIDDRRATFRTVVALATPAKEEVVAEGQLQGEIATEPRGGGGFGYDPVFAVGARTLAEMDLGEKNALSHRARALRALAEELTS